MVLMTSYSVERFWLKALVIIVLHHHYHHHHHHALISITWCRHNISSSSIKISSQYHLLSICMLHTNYHFFPHPWSIQHSYLKLSSQYYFQLFLSHIHTTSGVIFSFFVTGKMFNLSVIRLFFWYMDYTYPRNSLIRYFKVLSPCQVLCSNREQKKSLL